MRGLQWFNALSAGAAPVAGLPASLKVADGVLGEQAVRFIAVVPDAAWISAGMSGDFAEAIAAGATHLRIGTAITGARPAHG